MCGVINNKQNREKEEKKKKKDKEKIQTKGSRHTNVYIEIRIIITNKANRRLEKKNYKKLLKVVLKRTI